MTAVIRVKRHLQDDPVEAVRLECKRRRTEEAACSTSFEKVLKFVGTVEKKEDLVCQRTLGISTAYLERLKQLRSNRRDILSKLRIENKARSEESRFKVISCLRSINDSDSGKKETPEDLTILDVNIEKDGGEGSSHKCSSEDNYVYDLYTAKFEDEDYKDVYLDNVVGIEPYTSEIVLDTHSKGSEVGDGSCDPDEEDSNDENHWKNFYPDEDGSDSEEIDVLTTDFQKFGTGDVCELSSDEGEEKYPNYEDRNDKRNYFYEEAEGLAGSSYARYKMNVLDESLNDESN